VYTRGVYQERGESNNSGVVKNGNFSAFGCFIFTKVERRVTSVGDAG